MVSTDSIRHSLFAATDAAGNVLYANKSYATSQQLAYVNSQGHAIIKVDNTTNVATGQNRNSVRNNEAPKHPELISAQQIRITSQDTYAIGSMWIIDVNHIPYGCSVCYESLDSSN